jgi:uncharacterized integral membrane protein
MKKTVLRLILLPIVLIVAVFALSNRQSIDLSLWPLPWEARAPLFVLLLVTLLLGIVIGGGLTWARGHRHRSAAREHRRASERLQRQLDAARSDRPRPPVQPPVVLPPSPQAPHQPDRALQPPPSFTPVNRAR